MLAPDFTALDALLARLGRGGLDQELESMPGGASTRRYFRAHLSSGTTVVAMFVPERDKPEEIHKEAAGAAPVAVRRWPFLEVADLLRSRGVHVPRILGEDTERGWLLLEDLGDDTLANYLLRCPGEKPALYTRAVRDLARAQAELADLPNDSIVRTRAFDQDLIRWEIDHFREWGLEARGTQLAAEDRATFDAIGDRMARKIAAFSQGFTHRDYQSRNLMVREQELVWIDFQDALLGPRVYDLVALLNDSYQEFDRAFVEARLDEYAAAAGLSAAERDKLGYEFDLVTVQRKLKDAGRFVFIDRMKQNASFLRFVTPTIHKVKASLARLAPHDDDMRQLEALLQRILPDAP